MTNRPWLITISLSGWSGEALAQARSRQDGEIIVTGERMERSIMDTASSVVVFGARDARERSADQVDQLLSSVPNVQVGSASVDCRPGQGKSL